MSAEYTKTHTGTCTVISFTLCTAVHLDTEIYIRKHIFMYLPLKIYGFAWKQMYYFEQWRRRRRWTEQTGVGILIGGLVLKSLYKTRIMFAMRWVRFCYVGYVIKGNKSLMQNRHWGQQATVWYHISIFIFRKCHEVRHQLLSTDHFQSASDPFINAVQANTVKKQNNLQKKSWICKRLRTSEKQTKMKVLQKGKVKRYRAAFKEVHQAVSLRSRGGHSRRLKALSVVYFIFLSKLRSPSINVKGVGCGDEPTSPESLKQQQRYFSFY